MGTGLYNFVFVGICAALINPSLTAHWRHGQEELWDQKCKEGTRQSPINLRKNEAAEVNFAEFEFKNYKNNFIGVVANNGHTVKMNLEKTDITPSIKGGGLPNEYKLDHLHFHWESEHTIHSNRYPLELHMVHYNKKFDTIKDALGDESGLAVLAVLFEISKEDNNELQKIIDEVIEKNLKIDKAKILDGTVNLENFLPETDGFFRYEGSLTTPSCDESVIWTIFTDFQTLSERQFKQFQSLQTGEEEVLSENFRSLQARNKREVTLKRGKADSGTSISNFSKGLSIFVAAIIYKNLF